MPSITYLSHIERESADCTTGVLKDDTGYGLSGVPNRNTLALHLTYVKRSVDLVDTAIEIDNSLPLTVSEWNFNIPAGYQGDGWYYATFRGFPIYAAGTYNTNNCVYYSTTQRYYLAKADGVTSVPTVTADWEDISTDLSVVDNLTESNVAVNYTHNFTTCKSEIPVSDVLESLADQITNNNPKDWEDTTSALLGLALINGAWVKHYRVRNQEAQRIVNFINQRYPNRI